MTNNVLDRSGRRLLAAGETVNDRHLRMFRSWGVQEAEVADTDHPENIPAGDSADETARLQAVEAELKPLFRNNNLEHPAMGELFRLCLLRKSSHAAV